MQGASPINSLARILSLPSPRSSEASLINMNFSSLNNAQRPISKNYKRFEGSSVALIAWEIKVLLAR